MSIVRRAVVEYRNQGPIGFLYKTYWFLKMTALTAANLLLATFLSLVRSRSDGLWVFGSRYGFVDNPKYQFLYVANNVPSIRPVWITHDREAVAELRNRGYEAYYAYSPSAMRVLSRAGAVVFEDKKFDVGVWGMAGGARTVNTWHGVGIKDYTVMPWHLATSRSADHLVLTSTRRPMEIFADRPFTVNDREEFKRRQALVCGYPRNDIFFREVTDFDIGIDRDVYQTLTTRAENEFVVGYLPTFRPYEDHNPLLDDEESLAELDELLAKLGATLVVKIHRNRTTKLDQCSFERILEVPPSVDPQPYLAQFDALVTDYSSVFYTFLSTGRPTILFPYDYETYSNRQGFQVPYEEFPGPRPMTVPDLFEWIEYFAAGNDEFADDRASLCEEFFDFRDGNACERVVDHLQRR